MERLPQAETELVQRAANCDDEAFCALRDRYARHLRMIIARYAADPEDREDLLSEITAKLLEDDRRVLRAWQPIAPFGAFLTAIAVRHCLAWLDRKNTRSEHVARLQPAAEDADVADILERLIPADDKVQPEAAVIRRDRQETLHGFIMQLSDSDRLVLSLRFGEGMSGPAIARLLGISRGAARQRIYKALRRLAAIINQHDAELSLSER